MTNYGQGTTSNREPDVIDSDEDAEYVTNILGLPNADAFKIQEHIVKYMIQVAGEIILVHYQSQQEHQIKL